MQNHGDQLLVTSILSSQYNVKNDFYSPFLFVVVVVVVGGGGGVFWTFFCFVLFTADPPEMTE